MPRHRAGTRGRERAGRVLPDRADAYGKLVIDHAASYTGAISNFTGTSTQSDAIDLKDIAFDSGFSFTYHDNSGTQYGRHAHDQRIGP